MDEPQNQSFHIGDGWYVKPGNEGSVTFYVAEPGELTLTAQTWASIVASVSHHGEGHDSYWSAYSFHVGVGDEMNRSSVNAQ